VVKLKVVDYLLEEAQVQDKSEHEQIQNELEVSLCKGIFITMSHPEVTPAL
jgi:hypothetical protein